MNIIRNIKSRLSMKLADRVGFKDIIEGQDIRYYTDCYGVEYMVAYPFSFFNFRTKTND